MKELRYIKKLGVEMLVRSETNVRPIIPGGKGFDFRLIQFFIGVPIKRCRISVLAT
jgi:hypothetical protein